MRLFQHSNRPRIVPVLIVALSAGMVRAESAPPQLPGSTVGLPVRVEQLVLPGTELEALPWEDKSPVVIQIEAVYPHGTDFRYDLVYQGLEPGEFDLRKFLRRKDGSELANVPPLVTKISTVLPPGQIQPHEPSFSPLPRLGGYRLLLGLAIALWLAILIWAIYPRRKTLDADSDDGTKPQSLADRLRPLVARAKAGDVDPVQLAQLERALVTYWRRKLSMGDLSAAQALTELRKHADAGPLILQLEAWLHRPGGDPSVNVNALLTPYENLRADEFDLAAADVEPRTLAATR
jgi:hypothetical protein